MWLHNPSDPARRPPATRAGEISVPLKEGARVWANQLLYRDHDSSATSRGQLACIHKAQESLDRVPNCGNAAFDITSRSKRSR